MANFPRLNPDTFYVNGNPIPASYFQGVDTAQTAGVDGDAGGTWAPSSAIVVGGAGMWAAGVWQLTMGSGSNVGAFFGPTPFGRLTHGDSDYIQLSTGATITRHNIVTGCNLGRDASGVSPSGNPYGLSPSSIARFAPEFTFAGGLANTSVPSTFFAYRRGARFLLPLRVHNGSTIQSVNFAFLISNTPNRGTTLPTIFPHFRVHRVDINGNLLPLAATTNGSGFFEMANPGTVSAYVATTGFVYTCNQNNVVDTSQYNYFAEVIDELPNGAGSGAIGGNIYTSATSLCRFIPDTRPQ